MMSTEPRRAAQVSVSAATALSYCYFLVSRIPPGKRRLLALLPVLYLFTLLPFSFSTSILRGTSAFFLVWLGNFKLVLFSFAKGPLANPNLSILHFISLASFPIKIKQGKPPAAAQQQKSPVLAAPTVVLLAVKGFLLAVLTAQFPDRQKYPRTLVVCFYGVHIYLALDVILGLSALASRFSLGHEIQLEPQFSAPYLSTSLQDFWGRRWNLMVTRILHPSVYAPVRARLGPLAAVLASFLVSGLMHEVMFYYITLNAPTGEATCFFALHGALVAAELWAKGELGKKGWRPVPAVVAAPLTLGLVLVTGLWLFFPPLLKNGAEERAVAEC